MSNLLLFFLRQCKRISIVFFILTFGMVHAQTRLDPAQPEAAGTLVIIGGALRTDNAVVWEKIVALSGGKGAKIAVIPAAAANPENARKNIADTLNRYGARAFVVPLAIRLKGSDYQKVANDPSVASQIRAAGGVYFSGGDQGRITQALVKPDGTKSAALEAIWDVYHRGGVIAGSSAGAAIMSSTMFYDAKAVLPTLQFGVNEGKEIAPGLGFIGDQVFVDQHLIIRGRFARMIPLMLKKNYKLGLGIDENTAMIVRGRADIEILGYKGAILMDLSEAISDAQLNAFNISNVKISYLDRGDRYNLQTKVLITSKEKQKGVVDPANPYNVEKKFYPDILGNTTVVDLMQDLIDNKQLQTKALAFGDPEAPNAEAGFEFTFSKTAESKGYFSSALGSDAYTVMNIRMDIRPIVMQTPLYRYK